MPPPQAEEHASLLAPHPADGLHCPFKPDKYFEAYQYARLAASDRCVPGMGHERLGSGKRQPDKGTSGPSFRADMASVGAPSSLAHLGAPALHGPHLTRMPPCRVRALHFLCTIRCDREDIQVGAACCPALLCCEYMPACKLHRCLTELRRLALPSLGSRPMRGSLPVPSCSVNSPPALCCPPPSAPARSCASARATCGSGRRRSCS